MIPQTLSHSGIVHRQVVGLSLIFKVADIQQIQSALQNLADSPRDRVSAPTEKEVEPGLKEEQRRTICVRFYVTADEEARLNQLTDGVKNRSRWLRARAFGQATPRPRLQIPEINRQAYTTLNYLRSEANQITRAVNTALRRNQVLPLSQEYLNTLQGMAQKIEAVGKELSKLNALDRLEEEDGA